MAAAFGELSDEQIVHKALSAERDLVSARFAHSMNQLENTARLGQLRKEIARLRTEARTREIAAGLGKDELLSRHMKTFRPSEGGAAPVEAPAEGGGFLKGIVDKLTGKE